MKNTAQKPHNLLLQTPRTDATPFVSRFNRWLKVIAVVVLAAFVPDQASWAFDYNPAVIYQDLMGHFTQGAGPKPDVQATASLEYLLKQIQDKPELRLEVNVAPGRNLTIDTKTVFTADKIDQITQWLKTPNLNVFNCGVYALKDILEANGIHRSLQEVSVMTLSVDIMADIIKTGGPKLKTTLLAINKTAQALGLDYQALRVAPEDELQLTTPFIAHFKNEHFVTVQKIAGTKVYYTELDYPRIVDQDQFTRDVDGFAFARPPPEGISAQLVPQPMQAFVWGDKWKDLSSSLPGIVSGSALTLQLVFMIASILVQATGIFSGVSDAIGSSLGITPGGGIGDLIGMSSSGSGSLLSWAPSIFKFEFAIFQESLSQLMGTLATICVMKKACSPGTAFILSTALTSAITMGVGALNPQSDVGAPAVSDVMGDSGGWGAVPAGDVAAGSSSGFMDSLNWGAFPKAFATGLVVGAAKGFAELEATQLVSNVFCPASAGGGSCSDTNTILQQGVGAIANAIASQAAVFAVAEAGMTIDPDYFGKTFGLMATNGQAAVQGAEQNGTTTTLNDFTAQQIADKTGLPVKEVSSWLTSNSGGVVSAKNLPIGVLSAGTLDDVGKIINNTNAVSNTPLNNFGDAFMKTITNLAPNVVGQAAGTGARLLALSAGIKPQDNLSNAIGLGVNTIAQTAFQNAFPGTYPSRSITAAALSAVIGFGLGLMANSVVGQYNETEAKQNPGYANQYAYSLAAFEDNVLTISNALSAVIMAQVNDTAVLSSDGTENSSWFKRIWLAFNSPSPDSVDPGAGTVSFGNNGAPYTSSGTTSGYGPTVNEFDNFQGRLYMNQYFNTGSWGSIANYVNFSDSMDESIGVTANFAVSADNQLKQMQMNNKTVYGPAQRAIGGLIVPGTVTPAVSNSTLENQWILSLFESRMIGNMGFDINYITGLLGEAGVQSVQNLAGVIANAGVTDEATHLALVQAGLPWFHYFEMTDASPTANGNKLLFIGQTDENGVYSGAEKNGNLVITKTLTDANGESYISPLLISPFSIEPQNLVQIDNAHDAPTNVLLSPDGQHPNTDQNAMLDEMEMGGNFALYGTPLDVAIILNYMKQGHIIGVIGGNGNGFTAEFNTSGGLSDLTMQNVFTDNTGWFQHISGQNLPAKGNINPYGNTVQGQNVLQYFNIVNGKNQVTDSFSGALNIYNGANGNVVKEEGNLAAMGVLTQPEADAMKQATDNMALVKINPLNAAAASGDAKFQQVAGLAVGIGDTLVNNNGGIPVAVGEQVGARLNSLGDENGKGAGPWLMYFSGNSSAGPEGNNTSGGMILGNFDLAKNPETGGYKLTSANNAKLIGYGGTIGGFQNIWNLTGQPGSDLSAGSGKAAIVGFNGFNYSGQTGTSNAEGEIYTYLNSDGTPSQAGGEKGGPGSTYNKLAQRFDQSALDSVIGPYGTVAAVKDLGAGPNEAYGGIAPGAQFAANPKTFMPDMLFKVNQGGVIEEDASGNVKLYTVDNLQQALAESTAVPVTKSGTVNQHVEWPTVTDTGKASVTSANYTGLANYVAKTGAALDIADRLANAGIVMSLVDGGMPSIFLDRATLFLGNTTMDGMKGGMIQAIDNITPNDTTGIYSQGRKIVGWNMVGRPTNIQITGLTQKTDGEPLITFSDKSIAYDPATQQIVIMGANPINPDGSQAKSVVFQIPDKNTPSSFANLNVGPEGIMQLLGGAGTPESTVATTVTVSPMPGGTPQSIDGTNYRINPMVVNEYAQVVGADTGNENSSGGVQLPSTLNYSSGSMQSNMATPVLDAPTAAPLPASGDANFASGYISGDYSVFGKQQDALIGPGFQNQIRQIQNPLLSTAGTITSDLGQSIFGEHLGVLDLYASTEVRSVDANGNVIFTPSVGDGRISFLTSFGSDRMFPNYQNGAMFINGTNGDISIGASHNSPDTTWLEVDRVLNLGPGGGVVMQNGSPSLVDGSPYTLQTVTKPQADELGLLDYKVVQTQKGIAQNGELDNVYSLNTVYSNNGSGPIANESGNYTLIAKDVNDFNTYLRVMPNGQLMVPFDNNGVIDINNLPAVTGTETSTNTQGKSYVAQLTKFALGDVQNPDYGLLSSSFVQGTGATLVPQTSADRTSSGGSSPGYVPAGGAINEVPNPSGGAIWETLTPKQFQDALDNFSTATVSAAPKDTKTQQQIAADKQTLLNTLNSGLSLLTFKIGEDGGLTFVPESNNVALWLNVSKDNPIERNVYTVNPDAAPASGGDGGYHLQSQGEIAPADGSQGALMGSVRAANGAWMFFGTDNMAYKVDNQTESGDYRISPNQLDANAKAALLAAKGSNFIFNSDGTITAHVDQSNPIVSRTNPAVNGGWGGMIDIYGNFSPSSQDSYIVNPGANLTTKGEDGSQLVATLGGWRYADTDEQWANSQGTNPENRGRPWGLNFVSGSMYIPSPDDIVDQALHIGVPSDSPANGEVGLTPMEKSLAQQGVDVGALNSKLTAQGAHKIDDYDYAMVLKDKVNLYNIDMEGNVSDSVEIPMAGVGPQAPNGYTALLKNADLNQAQIALGPDANGGPAHSFLLINGYNGNLVSSANSGTTLVTDSSGAPLTIDFKNDQGLGGYTNAQALFNVTSNDKGGYKTDLKSVTLQYADTEGWSPTVSKTYTGDGVQIISGTTEPNGKGQYEVIAVLKDPEVLKQAVNRKLETFSMLIDPEISLFNSFNAEADSKHIQDVIAGNKQYLHDVNNVFDLISGQMVTAPHNLYTNDGTWVVSPHDIYQEPSTWLGYANHFRGIFGNGSQTIALDVMHNLTGATYDQLQNFDIDNPSPLGIASTIFVAAKFLTLGKAIVYGAGIGFGIGGAVGGVNWLKGDATGTDVLVSALSGAKDNAQFTVMLGAGAAGAKGLVGSFAKPLANFAEAHPYIASAAAYGAGGAVINTVKGYTDFYLNNPTDGSFSNYVNSGQIFKDAGVGLGYGASYGLLHTAAGAAAARYYDVNLANTPLGSMVNSAGFGLASVAGNGLYSWATNSSYSGPQIARDFFWAALLSRPSLMNWAKVAYEGGVVKGSLPAEESAAAEAAAAKFTWTAVAKSTFLSGGAGTILGGLSGYAAGGDLDKAARYALIGGIAGLAGGATASLGGTKFLNPEMSLGKQIAIKTVGGAGVGAAGGLVLSLADSSINSNDWNKRLQYALYGAGAGALMGLSRSLSPRMMNWAQTGELAEPTSSVAYKIGIRQIAENPMIIPRLSFAGAMDFGAIMPVWNMVDVPIRAAVNYADTGQWGQSLDKAMDNFKTRDANGNVLPLGYKFLGDVAGGMQMGMQLGPGLSVFQMPVNALVTPTTNSIEKGIYETVAQYGHSMVATVMQLDVVEVATQKFLEQNPGLQQRLQTEGETKAKEEGYSNSLDIARVADEYVQEQNHDLAQQIAFVSLFFKPSPEIATESSATARGAAPETAEPESPAPKGPAVTLVEPTEEEEAPLPLVARTEPVGMTESAVAEALPGEIRIPTSMLDGDLPESTVPGHVSIIEIGDSGRPQINGLNNGGQGITTDHAWAVRRGMDALVEGITPQVESVTPQQDLRIYQVTPDQLREATGGLIKGAGGYIDYLRDQQGNIIRDENGAPQQRIRVIIHTGSDTGALHEIGEMTAKRQMELYRQGRLNVSDEVFDLWRSNGFDLNHPEFDAHVAHEVAVAKGYGEAARPTAEDVARSAEILGVGEGRAPPEADALQLIAQSSVALDTTRQSRDNWLKRLVEYNPSFPSIPTKWIKSFLPPVRIGIESLHALLTKLDNRTALQREFLFSTRGVDRPDSKDTESIERQTREVVIRELSSFNTWDWMSRGRIDFIDRLNPEEKDSLKRALTIVAHNAISLEPIPEGEEAREIEIRGEAADLALQNFVEGIRPHVGQDSFKSEVENITDGLKNTDKEGADYLKFLYEIQAKTPAEQKLKADQRAEAEQEFYKVLDQLDQKVRRNDPAGLEYRIGQYSALETQMDIIRGDKKLDPRLLTIVFNMGGGKSSMIESMYETLAPLHDDKAFLYVTEDGGANKFRNKDRYPNYNVLTSENPTPIKGMVNVIEQTALRNTFLQLEVKGLSLKEHNPFKGATVAIDEGHMLVTSPNLVISMPKELAQAWFKEATRKQIQTERDRGAYAIEAMRIVREEVMGPMEEGENIRSDEMQRLVENGMVWKEGTDENPVYYVNPQFNKENPNFGRLFNDLDRAGEVSAILEKYTKRIMSNIVSKDQGDGRDQSVSAVELEKNTAQRVTQRLTALGKSPFRAEELSRLMDAGAGFLRSLHQQAIHYYLANDGSVNELRFAASEWAQLKDAGLVLPREDNKYYLNNGFTGKEEVLKSIFPDETRAKTVIQELEATRHLTEEDASLGIAPFANSADGKIELDRLFSDKSGLNAFQIMALAYWGRNGMKLEGTDLKLSDHTGQLTDKGLRTWVEQVKVSNPFRMTGARTIDILKRGGSNVFIFSGTVGESEVSMKAMKAEFLQAERDVALRDLLWRSDIRSGTTTLDAVRDYIGKYFSSGNVPDMLWFNTNRFAQLRTMHRTEGLEAIMRQALKASRYKDFNNVRIEVMDSEEVKSKAADIKNDVRNNFERSVQNEIDTAHQNGEQITLDEAIERAKKKIQPLMVLTSVGVGADIQIGKNVSIKVDMNGETVEKKIDDLFKPTPQVYIGARSISDILQIITRFNAYDPDAKNNPLARRWFNESKRSIGETTWVLLPDEDWNLSDETRNSLREIEKANKAMAKAIGPDGEGFGVEGLSQEEDLKAKQIVQTLLKGERIDDAQRKVITDLIEKMQGADLKPTRDALTTLVEARGRIAKIADSLSREKMYRGADQIVEQAVGSSKELFQGMHRVVEQSMAAREIGAQTENSELAPVARAEAGTEIRHRAGGGYEQIPVNSEMLWNRYDLQNQRIIAGTTPLQMATYEGAVTLNPGDVWDQKDNMIYSPEEWAKPESNRQFKAAAAEMYVPIPTFGLGAPMQKRMVMVTVAKDGQGQYVGKYEMPLMRPTWDAKTGELTAMQPEKLTVKLIYDQDYHKFVWTHPENGRIKFKLSGQQEPIDANIEELSLKDFKDEAYYRIKSVTDGKTLGFILDGQLLEASQNADNKLKSIFRRQVFLGPERGWDHITAEATWEYNPEKGVIKVPKRGLEMKVSNLSQDLFVRDAETGREMTIKPGDRIFRQVNNLQEETWEVRRGNRRIGLFLQNAFTMAQRNPLTGRVTQFGVARYDKKITARLGETDDLVTEKAITEHTYALDRDTNTWNPKQVIIKTDDFINTTEPKLQADDIIDEKSGLITRPTPVIPGAGKYISRPRTVGIYLEGRVLKSDGKEMTIDFDKNPVIREQFMPYLIRATGKKPEGIEAMSWITVDVGKFKEAITDVKTTLDRIKKNGENIRRPGEDNRDDSIAQQLWDLKEEADGLGLATEFVKIGADEQSKKLETKITGWESLYKELQGGTQIRLKFINEEGGQSNFMTKFLREELLQAAQDQLPQMIPFTDEEMKDETLKAKKVAEYQAKVKEFLDKRPMELVYDPYMERRNSAGLADNNRLALGTNALLILMKLGWGILDQGVSKHERAHMIDRVARMAGLETISAASRIDATQDDLHSRRGFYPKQYALGEIYTHPYQEGRDKWYEALRAKDLGDEDLYKTLKDDVVKVLTRPRNIALSTIFYAQDALDSLGKTPDGKVREMLEDDHELKDVIRGIFEPTGLDLTTIDTMVKALKDMDEKGQLPPAITKEDLEPWLSHAEGGDYDLDKAVNQINAILSEPITDITSFRHFISLKEMEVTAYEGDERGGRELRKFILKMPQYDPTGRILVKDMNGSQLKEMGSRLLKATKANLEYKAAAIDVLGRGVEHYADTPAIGRLVTRIFDDKLDFNERNIDDLRVLGAILTEKTQRVQGPNGSLILSDRFGRSATISSDGHFTVNGGEKGFRGDVREQFAQTLREASEIRLKDQQRWAAPVQEAYEHPQTMTGSDLEADSELQNSTQAIVEEMLLRDKTDNPLPMAIQTVGSPHENMLNVFAEASIASRAAARAMIYREGNGGDIKAGTVVPKETAGGYWKTYQGANLEPVGIAKFINAAGGWEGLTRQEQQLFSDLQKRDILTVDNQGKWIGKPGAIQVVFVDFDHPQQENDEQQAQRIETQVKLAQKAVKHEDRHGLEEVDPEYAKANDWVILQAIMREGQPIKIGQQLVETSGLLNAYVKFIDLVQKYNITGTKQQAEALRSELQKDMKDGNEKDGIKITPQYIEAKVIHRYMQDPVIRREVVGWLADMDQVRDALRGQTELSLRAQYGVEGLQMLPLISPQYNQLRDMIEKPLQQNYQKAVDRIVQREEIAQELAGVQAANDQDRDWIIGERVAKAQYPEAEGTELDNASRKAAGAYYVDRVSLGADKANWNAASKIVGGTPVTPEAEPEPAAKGMTAPPVNVTYNLTTPNYSYTSTSNMPADRTFAERGETSSYNQAQVLSISDFRNAVAGAEQGLRKAFNNVPAQYLALYVGNSELPQMAQRPPQEIRAFLQSIVKPEDMENAVNSIKAIADERQRLEGLVTESLMANKLPQNTAAPLASTMVEAVIKSQAGVARPLDLARSLSGIQDKLAIEAAAGGNEQILQEKAGALLERLNLPATIASSLEQTLANEAIEQRLPMAADDAMLAGKPGSSAVSSATIIDNQSPLRSTDWDILAFLVAQVGKGRQAQFDFVLSTITRLTSPLGELEASLAADDSKHRGWKPLDQVRANKFKEIFRDFLGQSSLTREDIVKIAQIAYEVLLRKTGDTTMTWKIIKSVLEAYAEAKKFPESDKKALIDTVMSVLAGGPVPATAAPQQEAVPPEASPQPASEPASPWAEKMVTAGALTAMALRSAVDWLKGHLPHDEAMINVPDNIAWNPGSSTVVSSVTINKATPMDVLSDDGKVLLQYDLKKYGPVATAILMFENVNSGVWKIRYDPNDFDRESTLESWKSVRILIRQIEQQVTEAQLAADNPTAYQVRLKHPEKPAFAKNIILQLDQLYKYNAAQGEAFFEQAFGQKKQVVRMQVNGQHKLATGALSYVVAHKSGGPLQQPQPKTWGEDVQEWGDGAQDWFYKLLHPQAPHQPMASTPVPALAPSSQIELPAALAAKLNRDVNDVDEFIRDAQDGIQVRAFVLAPANYVNFAQAAARAQAREDANAAQIAASYKLPDDLAEMINGLEGDDQVGSSVKTEAAPVELMNASMVAGDEADDTAYSQWHAKKFREWGMAGGNVSDPAKDGALIYITWLIKNRFSPWPPPLLNDNDIAKINGANPGDFVDKDKDTINQSGKDEEELVDGPQFQANKARLEHVVNFIYHHVQFPDASPKEVQRRKAIIAVMIKHLYGDQEGQEIVQGASNQAIPQLNKPVFLPGAHPLAVVPLNMVMNQGRTVATEAADNNVPVAANDNTPVVVDHEGNITDQYVNRIIDLTNEKLAGISRIGPAQSGIVSKVAQFLYINGRVDDDQSVAGVLTALSLIDIKFHNLRGLGRGEITGALAGILAAVEQGIPDGVLGDKDTIEYWVWNQEQVDAFQNDKFAMTLLNKLAAYVQISQLQVQPGASDDQYEFNLADIDGIDQGSQPTTNLKLQFLTLESVRNREQAYKQYDYKDVYSGIFNILVDKFDVFRAYMEEIFRTSHETPAQERMRAAQIKKRAVEAQAIKEQTAAAAAQDHAQSGGAPAVQNNFTVPFVAVILAAGEALSLWAQSLFRQPAKKLVQPETAAQPQQSGPLGQPEPPAVVAPAITPDLQEPPTSAAVPPIPGIPFSKKNKDDTQSPLALKKTAEDSSV